MTRTISTSVETLGYYVTLPEHIEDTFGSHFENLQVSEQFTLLATLAGYMANCAHPSDYSPTSLREVYNDVPGYLSRSVVEVLDEIENQPDGTIIALTEALVLNLHYTREVV